MARGVANANEKMTVKSLLDSNLWYRDIIIKAHEVVSLEKAYAEDLIAKGFCEVIAVSDK